MVETQVSKPQLFSLLTNSTLEMPTTSQMFKNTLDSQFRQSSAPPTGETFQFSVESNLSPLNYLSPLTTSDTDDGEHSAIEEDVDMEDQSGAKELPEQRTSDIEDFSQ